MKVNNATQKVIKKLPKKMQKIAKFVALQEGDAGLSKIRFVQDIAVNYTPKAIFSRSKADLAEVSFLELSESLLVYFGPHVLGEKVFRKLYTKKFPTALKDVIPKSASKIIKDKNISNDDVKKLINIKAAIATAALLIPITEFSLNFAKNLFTLKVFKQAEFKNIANLDKNNSKDDKTVQKKVKKNSIKNLKIAAGLAGSALGLSILLATRGKNSKILTKYSEFILNPGEKLFKNNQKRADGFNKYFSLDFSDKNGKLGLSRGQLTACVLAGGAGYVTAAKDRGKQNLLEVLFRFPLVGFYVVTGSEMFEKGYRKILSKKDSYKNLIDKDLNVPKIADLENLAKKVAAQNGSKV